MPRERRRKRTVLADCIRGQAKQAEQITPRDAGFICKHFFITPQSLAPIPPGRMLQPSRMVKEIKRRWNSTVEPLDHAAERGMTVYDPIARKRQSKT
jgi:hypothetical protein